MVTRRGFATEDGVVVELRQAAHTLRLMLPAVGEVLVGVRAADTTRAWRCRWRRRVAASIHRWQRALDLGAVAIRDQARWLDRLADWFEDDARARRLGAGAGFPAVAPPAAWARAPAAGTVDGPEFAPLARELAHALSDRPAAAGHGIGGDGAGGDGAGGDGAAGDGAAFDPELLAVLSARLREAASRAEALARAVDGVTDRVAALGAGPRAPVGGPDPMCLGLRLVGIAAPRVAAGIDRRMAHFAAAEAAVRERGVLIDQSIWFVDAEPLTGRGWSTVAAASAELTARIGSAPAEVTVADLAAVDSRLRGLSAPARQAVISRLRGRPLAVLAARTASLIDHAGIDDLAFVPVLNRLGDDLLAGAPAAMVGEVVAAFPGLEPEYPHPTGPSDPVFGADRTRDPLVRSGIAPDDVGQGDLADCYLAAALIGLARQDPDLLRERLRRNGNGTVTVTLWEHAPVAVTVRATLPARRTGAAGRGSTSLGAVPEPGAFDEVAMDGDNGDGQPELWPAIYEKAYARLHGGYPAIAFGHAAAALRTLTGRPVRELAADDVDAAGLAGLLAAGEVVVVSTRRRTRPAGLVAAHAYAVLRVDTGRRRVLLRNPWDPAPGSDNEHWYDWRAISPDVQRVEHGPTR